MNVTKLNRSGLNMSRLNASLLNASGIGAMGCKGKATMEDKIMDSMVLWYDLARQGATNESMAANPKLIDLSGNGHDATCYNFAWGGMSGVGGYVMSMSNFGLNGPPANITLSRTKTSIHIELTDEFAGDYVIGCSPTDWDLTKDRTFCINSTYSQGFKLSYYRSNVGVPAVDIPANGDVFVPANPDSDCKFLYFNLNSIRGAGTIDIELLPAYPDALVSDGVDDYISVSGLPILTPDKGYTVIAKRNIIDVPIYNIAFASKRKGGVGSGDQSGAFQVERIMPQGNVAFNFGSTNPVTIDRMGQTTYTWQNSKQYNNQALTISDSPDSDELHIFKWATQATDTMHGALYAFFLFDRDLTTEEIEWVKTNLIETKQ